MHLLFNMPSNPYPKVPKGPATKLAPIHQPANLFAFALPPTRTLQKNWSMAGTFWRKYTIPKESTNKRLDLPSLQLITLGAYMATHTLDLPGTLGILSPTNNQPPLPSKVNSTHFVRTWTRSSPPLPTSSPAPATTQDLLMRLH